MEAIWLIVVAVIPKDFKGRCFHNHNKKVCYLNTESLVLNITCNDFRKRLRSKVMWSTAKIDGISYAELVANRRWIAVFREGGVIVT